MQRANYSVKFEPFPDPFTNRFQTVSRPSSDHFYDHLRMANSNLGQTPDKTPKNGHFRILFASQEEEEKRMQKLMKEHPELFEQDPTVSFGGADEDHAEPAIPEVEVSILAA